MSDTQRRKWADIQIDLFLDAARTHSDADSQTRFEELFRHLVPPIRAADRRRPCEVERRDAPRAAAGKPTDPD